MKSFLLLIPIALLCLSGSTNAQQDLREAPEAESPTTLDERSFELSDFDKRLLKDRIARILEKDQQFRTYLSFKTIDDEKIATLKKLDVKEMLAAMSNADGALSDEVKDLLQRLQQKNDKENLNEFYSIVKEYGYPSAERLGVEADSLFVLLLHPPVELEEIETHTEKLSQLLLPEVKAGRMKPRLYATFIDNMRGKILRLPQIYGTNQQFDRASGKVLPPQIEDLGKANDARRKIGMPELKEGEYRLASTKR